MLNHIRVSEITEAHLLALIKNKVPENHTLEFKRQTYGKKDKDKKEFLKDITAFANADGGDLIIGIDENGDGVATSLVGISSSEACHEHERLEQIASSGVEPKMEFQLKEVPLENGQIVFVFRIPPSDVGPHRVKFAGYNRYYVRGSRITDEPDVEKLRKMFLAPYLREQKIRSFVDERIKLVADRNGPIRLKTNDWISIHIIPLRKANLTFGYGDLRPQNLKNKLLLMAAGGLSCLSNLDGIMTYTNNLESCRSYLQIFRDGAIEAVCCNWLRKNNYDDGSFAPGMVILDTFLEGTQRYVSALEMINASGPYLVFWSLNGFSGVPIKFFNSFHYGESTPIGRPILRIPEVKIDELNNVEDAREKLRPCMDTLFQASGFERCLYFDENGEWKPPQ